MADHPQVGDTVIHHGRPHEVVEVGKRATLNEKGNPVSVDMVIFENGDESSGYRNKTPDLEDFRQLEDGVWYLDGRLLARNERALHAAITGAWPSATRHLQARQYLDAVDYDDLDTPGFREELADVVRRRKVDFRELAAEADEDEEELLEAYVEEMLAQCRELKELRS